MNNMINLSVSEPIDGLGKIEELRGGVGSIYSDNHSSTGYSVLLQVSGSGDICITQEVRGEYSKKDAKPGINRQPSWLVLNGMFF